MNGDGVADFIVSAPGHSPGGLIYVIFGKAGAFGANLDLGALTPSQGFRIIDSVSLDYAGKSVSAAGDVNGDGFDDLIIGAPYADPNGVASGSAFVVFGKASFAADVDIATLDGTNGFRLNGIGDRDYTGGSVSGAGDINGDGFDDLVVAAPFAENGATFVVFGKGSSFAATIELSTLDGSNGFRISGDPVQGRGSYTVSGAGDINGDGFEDIVIGDPGARPNGSSTGAAYVLFGKAGGFMPDISLAALDGTNGFRISGSALSESTGFSVSGAGDINGDSFADIIIGAVSAAPNGLTGAGAAYIVFGKGGVFSPDLNVASLDGNHGFKLSGAAANDALGWSVGRAGDVNNDGFGDVIVGALKVATGGSNAGAAYVVYGKPGGFSPELNVSALNGVNGFKLNGAGANESAGNSVSGAGDINGDGFDDVIVAAYRADPNGNDSGAAYIVFGAAVDLTPTVTVSDVTVAEGGIRNSFATFKVTLSVPSDQVITVQYMTADGTAAAGSDHQAQTLGTLTFAPGEVSKTVQVMLIPDAVVEADETFFLDLSNATNATLGTTQAKATILNDDAVVDISPSGKQATITDSDGDRITIKTSKGTLESANFVFGPDGSLQAIDFGGDQRFAGTNLSITAKQAAGGNGVVDVDLIDASEVDLGRVTVSGNLGRIVVGDGDPRKPALKSLNVGSLGTDEALTDPLISEIRGSVRKINVRDDVRGAAVDVQGIAGLVKIGGDLTGDLDAGAVALAAMLSSGETDPRVGGEIPTGAFNAEGIGTFSVGGSMEGGSVNSGGDVGGVNVGGDLHSGAVAAGGQIRNVKILGSVIGDDPSQPSVVAALARIGSTKPKSAIAIDAIQVRGDVENAQILLGYRQDQTDAGVRYLPRNPDASGGRILVRGDWSASSLAAGVFDATGDGFGQNDQLITGDSTSNIMARIAKIVIKGTAIGSDEAGDHYAIIAQEIGKLSIGGENVPLTEAKDNILLDVARGDFRVVEI